MVQETMKSKEGKFREGTQQWHKKVKLDGNWEKATTFGNEVISYLLINCSF